MIFFAHIVVGVWIVLSPWLFGLSGNALMLWSNVIIGLLLIIGNVWLIFGSPHAPPELAVPEPKTRERKKEKVVTREQMTNNL